MLTINDIENMIKSEFIKQSARYAMRCDDIRNINAIIRSISPKAELIKRPYPLNCIMCIISGVYLTRGEY